jgi:urease accessory protein
MTDRSAPHPPTLLCERILDSIKLRPLRPCQIQDAIDLNWKECPRRAFRKISRRGRAVAVLLPTGSVLRHGDVLFDRADLRISVEVAPCQLLVARPSDPRLFGLLVFEIGNLHIPAEIGANEVAVPADGPVQEICERLGIPFGLENRRFSPVFVAAGVMLSPAVRIIQRSIGGTTKPPNSCSSSSAKCSGV